MRLVLLSRKGITRGKIKKSKIKKNVPSIVQIGFGYMLVSPRIYSDPKTTSSINDWTNHPLESRNRQRNSPEPENPDANQANSWLLRWWLRRRRAVIPRSAPIWIRQVKIQGITPPIESKYRFWCLSLFDLNLETYKLNSTAVKNIANADGQGIKSELSFAEKGCDARKNIEET